MSRTETLAVVGLNMVMFLSIFYLAFFNLAVSSFKVIFGLDKGYGFCKGFYLLYFAFTTLSFS